MHPSPMQYIKLSTQTRSNDGNDSNNNNVSHLQASQLLDKNAVNAMNKKRTHSDCSNNDSDDTSHVSTRPKWQKVVQFAKFAQYRPIPSRFDLHPLLRSQMYLNDDDMKRTKASIVQTLRKLGKAGKHEMEGESIRGLEKCIPSHCEQRAQRISQSISAVVQLQKLPNATPERLAKIYQQRTRPSVCMGYMRGALDHIAVTDNVPTPCDCSIETLQKEVVSSYDQSIM